MSPNTSLVINCGSSSVKFAVFAAGNQHPLCSGQVSALKSSRAALTWRASSQQWSQALPNASHKHAIETIMSCLEQHGFTQELNSVGHRVVHGGSDARMPLLINQHVEKLIQRNSEFAPLHNPANLAGIAAIKALTPNLPQVAVFDTAFHHTLPKVAKTYAIPLEWQHQFGVQRFGFHGINHHYIATCTTDLLRQYPWPNRVVSAHLGNGCSVCAIMDGKSIDTSMGFTPLEGLVMGTRSGDIDAGILEFLCEKLNIDLHELTFQLNQKSGLKGLSGISGDMKNLLQERENNNPKAALAIDLFCYRLAKYIASYQVPLQGQPAIVFTGGIGEYAPAIRQSTTAWLAPLGFRLDDEKNERQNSQARLISAEGSPPMFVIPANEEWMIAQQTFELLNQHDTEH